MAGSGGGTAQGTADYQMDTHALILGGYTVDAAPLTWDGLAADDVYHRGGAYDDYPSVLRFIHDKGLTGVGGNPFEGVSAYNPGDALDEMSESFDDFMTKVDDIDSDSDWGSFLDLAQAEQTGQVPELDVDAIFTGVIGDSLARALQLATQAYSTAKLDGENLMDSVVTRAGAKASAALATAEAEADIRSSLLVSDERDGATLGMTDARTAFGLTETDTQADVEDVFGDAAAKAAEDFAGIATAGRIAATEGMADSRTAFGSLELDAQADVSDVFGDAVDKAIAEAEDMVEDDDSLGTSMSFMSNQAQNDASSSATQAARDSLDAASAMIDKVNTEILANEALAEIASDTIYTDAEADGKTGIATLADAASSAMKTNEDVLDSVGVKADEKVLARVQNAAVRASSESDNVISDINTKVGTTGALAETQSDNIYDDAEDDAESAMDSISAGVVSTTEAFDSKADVVARVNSQEAVEASAGDAVTHADALSTAELAKGWANADTIDDKALASAGLTMDGAVDTARTRALTDATSAESSIRTSAKEAMLDIMDGATPEVSSLIQASLQDALTGAQTAISMAISAAEEIIESAPIAKAVASYRRRALTEHLRSVNRFAGGMSDVNAVNSSAFIIGMALQESEFEGKVLDYQAELETKLYIDAFPIYVDTFKNVMNSYLETYAAQQSHMISIANNSTNTITGMFVTSLTQYIESYMRGFVEYVGMCKDMMAIYSEDAKAVMGLETRLYEGIYGNVMNAETQLSDVQSRMIQASVGLRQSMVNSLSKMQMEIYAQVLTTYIDTEAGIFNAGMGSAANFGNLQGNMIKELADSRQRLAIDLGKLYVSSHDGNLSSQLRASMDMFKSGFDGANQAGNSKTAVTKELVDKYLRVYTELIAQQNNSAGVFNSKTMEAKELINTYLRTYVDILAQQGNNANVFSNMGKGKMAAFKDMLAAKLEVFSRIADKELDVFNRDFLGHIQAAGSTLNDHFRGTIESRLEEKREKQMFVNTHTTLLQNMSSLEIESHRAATLLLAELQKAIIIARGEEDEKNLEYDSRAAVWDMDLFQMGGNVLSSVTGSVIQGPNKPSKTQSMIGGAFSGAAQGMQLGTAIAPGVGSVIGGVAGALAGTAAGAN